MSAVTVGAPYNDSVDGHPAVCADIQAGGEQLKIYFRSTQGEPSRRADAFLACALLPAMRLGVPVHVDGEVSARVLCNLPTFQSIIHNWFNDYKEVPVSSAQTHETRHPRATGVACFFSGGVDSFHSVLTHLDEVTHLIFVHGFDAALEKRELRETIAQGVRQAAAGLGKPLIEVETNARSLLDRYGDWDAQMHGLALAAVALAQTQFKKVYMAAPVTYAMLSPLGLHPMTTPLWSTEQMDIALAGLETFRWDKFEQIKNNDAVRRWLRVCWFNTDGMYNCNRCSKCLPVRIMIRVSGLQDHFASLSPLVDLKEIEDFAQTWHHRAILARLYKQLARDYPAADVTQKISSVLSLPAPPGADRASQLEYEVWQLKAHIGELEDEGRALQKQQSVLMGRLAALQRSRSWQLTAPLRAAAAALQGLRR